MHWHLWQWLGFPRFLWRFGPLGLDGWHCCDFSNQHGRRPAGHGVEKSPPRNSKYSTARFCCAGILGTGTPLMCPCAGASSTEHVLAVRCCLGTGPASDPSVVRVWHGPACPSCRTALHNAPALMRGLRGLLRWVVCCGSATHAGSFHRVPASSRRIRDLNLRPDRLSAQRRPFPVSVMTLVLLDLSAHPGRSMYLSKRHTAHGAVTVG